MPIFKSKQPPIDMPWHLPVWTWLFDSEYSPMRHKKPEEIGGFTNAMTKEHLSYVDLRTHSTHLSTALTKNYGLKQGQTVALFSPNTVWYPCAMFGVLRAGGVVSGASPAYNIEEMTYALKTAEAKFLFTVPSSMEVAAAAAKNAGIPQSNVFLLEGTMTGFTTMKELLEMGKKHGEQGQIEQFRLPPGKKNKDVCGFLSFSSGTTGLPKAVMIAHSNVIAQCLQIQQISPDTLRRILAVLPLFHITGLVHQMHLPVLLNATVYMLPAFNMDSMLQTVQDYKLEEMLLVPPILIRMVRDEKTLSKYDLSSLKRFSSGAAPLSAEILQLLEKRFPGSGFKQGYGMTESCSCITAHPPEFYDFKYAFRVGTIVASTEVKIVDPDTGRECGLNEPGEIWARGPQIVMGYLNNPKATRETFDQDGFLHTGDIGSLDAEGLITITDRLKEMIKVKGIGVAPAELEDLLLGHDSVEDVAVLGIPDDYSGERPKAYIVLKPAVRNSDVQGAGKSLIKYVQDKKVRHKWVTEVEFIEEIPKSPSGKILRRVLRDMARSGKKGVVVKDNRERARL
jgi:4-coumarate--CoA ligase